MSPFIALQLSVACFNGFVCLFACLFQDNLFLKISATVSRTDSISAYSLSSLRITLNFPMFSHILLFSFSVLVATCTLLIWILGIYSARLWQIDFAFGIPPSTWLRQLCLPTLCFYSFQHSKLSALSFSLLCSLKYDRIRHH